MYECQKSIASRMSQSQTKVLIREQKYTNMKDQYAQIKGTTSSTIFGGALQRFGVPEGAFERFVARKRCSNSRVRRFVQSEAFGTFTSLVICLNAVLLAIGLENDTSRMYERFDRQGSSADHAPPHWIDKIDQLFCVYFTIELLFRIFVEEFQFFCGKDWIWHSLDTLVVFSCIFESVLDFSRDSSRGGRSMTRDNLQRSLRMFRAARIVRVLRQFHALKVTLLSIMASLLPFLWAYVFLGLSIFIFAAVIQQAVINHLAEASVDDPAVPLLRPFFNSFPETLLTLFYSVTGGVDWGEVEEALLAVSLGYGLFFIAYMSIMVLGVLNVITGIFVEATQSSASQDRELVRQADQKKTSTKLRLLTKLFHELDQDNTGVLTLAEFQEYAQTEELRALFTLLEMDCSHPELIFKLLDVDENGELEIVEFVMGCVALKGGASATAQEAFMQENRQFIKRLVNIATSTREDVHRVEKAVHKLVRGRAHSTHTTTGSV